MTSANTKPHTIETQGLKQAWLHILLLAIIASTIVLLIYFDYFNIEKYPSTTVQLFYFERTWKGRMFYIIFLWIMLIETIFEWENITKTEENALNLLSIPFALAPIIYVVSFNQGLDSAVIDWGRTILAPEYSSGENLFFLTEHWPLSIEHLFFFLFFLLAFAFAYRKHLLRFFSTSFTVIGGIGTFYLIDTIFPFSLSTPLQLIAIPTAAWAAVLAKLLGYNVVLNLYWTNLAPQLMVIKTFEQRISANVAWPCAGVQSLFIYTVIMILFLRKSSFSTARKLVYFVIGALGTYFINVVRIVAFYVASLEISRSAGAQVHDVYGELFFLGWMGLFFLSIFCIERYRLVERLRDAKKALGRPFSGVA
ncbi:MAG: exosortase/archaeosortase family protein [Candidatus Bathyarchaeia archaeon]